MALPDDVSLTDLIRAQARDAEFLIEQSGHAADYTIESVTVLEEVLTILEPQLQEWIAAGGAETAQVFQILCSMAAYLGEAMRRTAGGEWECESPIPGMQGDAEVVARFRAAADNTQGTWPWLPTVLTTLVLRRYGKLRAVWPLQRVFKRVFYDPSGDRLDVYASAYVAVL